MASGGRRIMKRRILCLYLPNWPIQQLAARNPAFRTPQSALPILLHSRDSRRGGLVVACNAAAVDCGVRLGMPLAEAAALVEHRVSGGRGGHSPPYLLPHD